MNQAQRMEIWGVMKKEQRKKDGGMPMCDSKVRGMKVWGVYGNDV